MIQKKVKIKVNYDKMIENKIQVKKFLIIKINIKSTKYLIKYQLK